MMSQASPVQSGSLRQAGEGRLLAVCALAYFLDLSDLAVGNAFSALFYAESGAFDRSGLPLLLASVFVGAVIGMPFLGAFAKRTGCRSALILATATLSITSFLQAASSDMTMLTVFRFLAGIAIGALPALIFACLANRLPEARRGRLSLIVSVVALVGVPMTFFGIRWLTPIQPFGIEGWRCALGLHGVASAICTMLFFFVENDARPQTGAGAAPARAIFSVFRAASTRWRMIALAILSAFTPWPTIGFTLVGGAVLSAKGFDVGNSLLYLGVSFTGPIIGNFLVSIFVDRFDRRTLMALTIVAMAVLGPIFAVLDTLVGLMIVGTAFTMAAAIFVPLFLIYAAELFAPADRPLTNSLAWAVNRGFSGVVPLALLPLLVSSGTIAMFTVIVMTLIAMLALLYLVPALAVPRS